LTFLDRRLKDKGVKWQDGKTAKWQDGKMERKQVVLAV
jgi:hypothetical protein